MGPITNSLQAAAVAALLSGLAVAAPQSFEARNSAMGGTGVASSGYLSAGLTNPALLTRYDSTDDFGILVPALAGVLADEDELASAIDAFQNNLDDLQNRTPTPAELLALSAQILALGDRRLTGSAGFSFAAAIPSEEFGVAIVRRGHRRDLTPGHYRLRSDRSDRCHPDPGQQPDRPALEWRGAGGCYH